MLDGSCLFSPLVAHLLPFSTMYTSQEGEPLLLSISSIFPRGVVTKVCGIWHGKLCPCDISCIATSSFVVGFKVHTTGRSIMFVTVNSHFNLCLGTPTAIILISILHISLLSKPICLYLHLRPGLSPHQINCFL